MTRRYLDPIAQVVITNPDTGKEWHWGSPQYPFLTSVSFSKDMGAISAFSVGVDVPYDYMLGLTDINETPFLQGALVKARIGYASGGWTEWAEGFLQNGGKGLSVTPEGLSGTLEISWTSSKSIAYTPPTDLLRFAGTDPVNLITLLAEYLGYEVDISSGATDNAANVQEDEEGETKTVKEQKDAFFSALAGKKVLDIIKTIVDMMDCQWWLGRKGGIFGPRTLFVYTNDEVTNGVVNPGREPHKYVIRGILDENNGQFPCFGFDPADDSTSWISGSPDAAASGVTLSATDLDSGEVVEEDMTPEKAKAKVEGVLSSNTPVDQIFDDIVGDRAKGGEMGTYMAMPLRANGLKQMQDHIRSKMLQGDPGLRGIINTIGVPEEEVGVICELYGAGFLNDGPFFIERMIHTWTPGVWDMQITGLRRGYKAKSGEQKETAVGQMSQ